MGIKKRAIKSMFQSGKYKILRGDKVIITAGKDKGQTGIVSKVIRDEKIPRVIVEGRNLVRAQQIFSVYCPIDVLPVPCKPLQGPELTRPRFLPAEQKGNQTDSG